MGPINLCSPLSASQVPNLNLAGIVKFFTVENSPAEIGATLTKIYFCVVNYIICTGMDAKCYEHELSHFKA